MRITLLITSGFFAFACLSQEAASEEMVPSLPLEDVLPERIPVSSFVTEPGIVEEALPILTEETPLADSWPMHLPAGREVVLQSLQGKFVIGRRAIALIYHPKVTLSLQADKRFQTYVVSLGNPEVDWRLLTEEEKIERSLRFAESVTESIQALPVPFLGEFLSHCMRVGRQVTRFDKKIKKRYSLHLKYSGETFSAAYKEKF